MIRGLGPGVLSSSEKTSLIDHVVYVTPDVQQSIRDLSRFLGVTAVFGGRHPVWGTCNALLALGRQVYLEIMGPEPTLSRPGLVRPFAIDQLERPRLATWVAKSENLVRTVEESRQKGVELGEILSGSRTKPDGSVLSWSMTDLMAYREGGIVPFFINWGDSEHPAESAPKGCKLIELRAEHPDPGRIRSILGSLGIDVPVERGREFRLGALIQTPRGLVELQ